MSGKVIILRPMIFELAVVFAAGYIVGKYTQANVPTIAETRQLILDTQATGEVIDVPATLGKKPAISYDGDTVSIRIPRRRNR